MTALPRSYTDLLSAALDQIEAATLQIELGHEDVCRFVQIIDREVAEARRTLVFIIAESIDQPAPAPDAA